MANKPRLGLDYYQHPVNLCREAKTMVLVRRFGSKGYMARDILYEAIFEHGSYLKFDSIDELTVLIEQYSDASKEEAEDIVNGLIDLKVFDKDKFLEGYLTSLEIQKHYYFATKERKKRVTKECWLLSKDQMDEIDGGTKYKDIMSGENSISPTQNGINSRYKEFFDKDNEHSNSYTNRDSNTDTYSDSDTHFFSSYKESNNDSSIRKPSWLFKCLKMMTNTRIISEDDEAYKELEEYLYSFIRNYSEEEILDTVNYSLTEYLALPAYKRESHKRDIVTYLKEAISKNIIKSSRNDIVINQDNNDEEDDDLPF